MAKLFNQYKVTENGQPKYLPKKYMRVVQRQTDDAVLLSTAALGAEESLFIRLVIAN